MLVAVAACLLGPLVPAPATYTQRRWSEENLSRILLALHDYEAAHDRFPDDLRAGGRPALSWRVAVLPFLDGGRYAKLHAEFDPAEPWDGPRNRPLLARMPYPFHGGRDHRDGVRVARPTALTHYQVVRGPGAVYTADWLPRRLIDIRDGTSNTVVVAEAGPPVPWTKPADRPAAGPLPPGPYTDGVSLGFADGSVRTFRRPLPDDLLRALVLADDGGLIPAEQVARATAPPPPLNPAEAAELAAINARTAAARDRLVADLADLSRQLQALPPATDPRAAERIEEAVRELGSTVKRAGVALRPR